MKSQDATQFDEVIGNYYGREPTPQRLAQRAQTLLSNDYGKPPAPRRPAVPAPLRPLAAAVSLSCDNGERMHQRPGNAREAEYVVAGSLSTMADEYRMDVAPSARPREAAGCPAPGAARDAGSRAEYSVDLPTPQAPALAPSAPPALPALSASPAPRAEAPAQRPAPVAASWVAAAPSPARPPAMAAPAPSPEPVSEAKSSDDAFIEDMKAILSGQMVYDPRSKATVHPSQLGDAPASGSTGAEGWGAVPAAPAPLAAPSGDAIFERLAQSMQYANAYDLGTVELENRFADFDRVEELKRKAAAQKKAQPATGSAAKASPAPSVGSAEFLQDMDAIHSMQTSVAPRPEPSASSAPSRLSKPFFDTGEHVLFGGDYYPDQLRVGANPGLGFSYGQIIAMADLFESVDQMMGTNVGQLSKIKALIERSTAYYVGNKADPKKDVSDDEWDSVTGGRYLTLAEMNFEHFSPNFLFRNAVFASAAHRHGNNQSAWEEHHKRAIQEAQRIGAAPDEKVDRAVPLEGALIINAFGDHFLTDAFAAGHLINKDAIAEYWKRQFFNGKDLTSDAKDFFGRLAERAFQLGDVKARFSKLETVDTHYGFHPNINSASRFAEVLQGIAEQEPDRISNMVVKAIHDKLNEDGVEVFNEAGDGTWVIKGDGYLDPKNRQIIQRAVAQSIANINDPALMVSALNVTPFLDKVWKHVPQLTPATQQKVQRTVNQYVYPDSQALVEAAAQIIQRKVNLLIQELIKAKALRVA